MSRDREAACALFMKAQSVKLVRRQVGAVRAGLTRPFPMRPGYMTTFLAGRTTMRRTASWVTP